MVVERWMQQKLSQLQEWFYSLFIWRHEHVSAQIKETKQKVKSAHFFKKK